MPDGQEGIGVPEEVRERAARLVLKTWRGFRDRRVFQYLRHAVCRAEDSLTHQVLRRINPIEVYDLPCLPPPPQAPTCIVKTLLSLDGAGYPGTLTREPGTGVTRL
jgi:hypothetical protein